MEFLCYFRQATGLCMVRAVQMSQNNQSIQQLLAEARAGSGDLLEATIHEERLQQLSALMDQLSQGHRDVLRLRFYEQLPYTEIASVTRTTPQMARARFHRARKHLRAQLLCRAK